MKFIKHSDSLTVYTRIYAQYYTQRFPWIVVDGATAPSTGQESNLMILVSRVQPHHSFTRLRSLLLFCNLSIVKIEGFSG